MPVKRGIFIAHDREGRSYLVHVTTDVELDSSSQEPDRYFEGRSSYRLADGREVERLKPGEYRSVKTGTVIRADSPNEPE
jgi:hypothetical protein